MPLMGDLSDLSLPDLLYIFNVRGMTGRLTLQSDNDDAVLYFQRGSLTDVASSRISHHLGQLLVRVGKLTPDQLGSAFAMQATTHAGQPLGDIIISQGWVGADDMNTFLIYQAEEVLFRVLSWPSGSFTFSASATAPLSLPLKDVNVQQIILEATRRADEWAAICRRIPSLDCGVILLNDPSLTAVTDTLRLKARIIIASIMEGATTLRLVGQATGLDDHEVLRITHELVNQEVLAISSPSGTATASSPTMPQPSHRGLLAPHRGTTSAMRAPSTTG